MCIDAFSPHENIELGQRGGESSYFVGRLPDSGAPAKALRCTAKGTSTQGAFCVSLFSVFAIPVSRYDNLSLNVCSYTFRSKFLALRGLTQTEEQ